MNILINKFEYKSIIMEDSVIIDCNCLFNNIDDDKNLKLRIFSKKLYSDNKEKRDPDFLDSNTVFNISKNFSYKKIKFLFKIKSFDDFEYIKIGLVKEHSYWYDKHIYTINFNYLNNKNLFSLILNKIYLKTLNRKCDLSGFENFSNLIYSKKIELSEIPTIIKNSEEYISNNILSRKFSESKIEDINVLVECPANRCDGYGNSSHYFCESLAKKTKIRIIPTVYTSDISDDFSKLIIDRNNYKKYNTKNYLFFNIPNFIPSITKGDIKKYIFTMFESTKIPSSWPNIINNQFDNLIVPSNFCKDIFINNGIKVPVSVINLGVDPDIWPFYKRKSDKKIFKFLLFANAHWENTRKNYQLTLDAFIKAFGDNSDVSLVVKLTTKDTKFDNFKYKNVKFIFEKYNHNQMLDLVKDCDCMVFVSNGEGFGLPPREAMSTGLPVILMNWSSLSEICREDISYWINPTSLQPAVYPPEVWPMNDGSTDFGEFAKGSSDDLAQIMIHVYSNRDDALKKGLAASDYIRKYETYDIATNKLIKLMEK